MAHEELKALYEIDSQHSDTPWEFWEFHDGEEWLSAGIYPMFNARVKYRRKPDAPVWGDDKEDARKWRELEAFYQGNGITDTAKKFLEIIEPKQELIQGYTAEQWQRIIDEGFLCEFTDIEGFGGVPLIQTLKEIDPFRSESCLTWNFCRPLRIKGVRQPWFGGECPVDSSTLVVVIMASGRNRCARAADFNWNLEKHRPSRIVEFIEL